MAKEGINYSMDPESVFFEPQSGKLYAEGRDELEGLIFEHMYTIGLENDPLEAQQILNRAQSLIGVRVVLDFGVDDVRKGQRQFVPTLNGYGVWREVNLIQTGGINHE